MNTSATERPSLRVWLAGDAIAAAAQLEECGREVLPALEDPWVVVADRGEQAEQVLASLVAVVALGAANEVDQPVEGVLDPTAEPVEGGDQRLGGDIVGTRVRGGAGRVEVGVLGPLQECRH